MVMMASVECPVCGRLTGYAHGMVGRHREMRVRLNKSVKGVAKPVRYMTKVWCDGSAYTLDEARKAAIS